MNIKKRLVGVAIGVVAVGAVAGGTVAIAAPFGGGKSEVADSVVNSLVEEYSISVDQLEAAVKKVSEQKETEVQEAILNRLVTAGILTSDQKTELQNWLNSMPELDFDLDNLMQGGKGVSYLKKADIDAVIAALGLSITSSEFEAALKTTFEEQRAIYAEMTTMEKVLSMISKASSEGVITSSQATELTNWVNSTPSWLTEISPLNGFAKGGFGGSFGGKFEGGFGGFSGFGFGLLDTTDKFAEKLGVSKSALDSAIEQVASASKETNLTNKVNALVSGETITESQGTELLSWLSAKPEVSMNKVDEDDFSALSNLRGLDVEAVLEELNLDVSVTEFLTTVQTTYEAALEEKNNNYESSTPSERLLAKVADSLTAGTITSSESSSLSSWINTIPSWLDNNDTFESINNARTRGHRGFSGDFDGLKGSFGKFEGGFEHGKELFERGGFSSGDFDGLKGSFGKFEGGFEHGKELFERGGFKRGFDRSFGEKLEPNTDSPAEVTSL